MEPEEQEERKQVNPIVMEALVTSIKEHIRNTINTLDIMYSPGQDVAGPIQLLNESIIVSFKMADFTDAPLFPLYVRYERNHTIHLLQQKLQQLSKLNPAKPFDDRPKRKYTRHKTPLWDSSVARRHPRAKTIVGNATPSRLLDADRVLHVLRNMTAEFRVMQQMKAEELEEMQQASDNN